MKSGDDRSSWLAAILLAGTCRKISDQQIALHPGSREDARTFVDDDGGCGIARGYVRSSE